MMDDNDNHLSSSSTTSFWAANAKQECFVVQRCWFSGPDIHQPLDYLRLFDNRSDAEAAAFQSAHAWARSKAPHDPSVKTLLLPSNPTSNSAPTASYGFIAQGSLFWARPLMATLVSDSSSFYHVASVGDSGGNTTNSGGTVSLEEKNHNAQMAYAVVTEGVIGGTGNRNSRRGTEVREGRVFVGSSRAAHILALQVCHSVMATLPEEGCITYVASMAIGRPEEYESPRFLQEWPPEVGRHMAMETSSNENRGSGGGAASKRGNYCLTQKQHRLSHHQQPSHPLAAMVASNFANRHNHDHNNNSGNAGMPNFLSDASNNNSDNHSAMLQQLQQGAPKRRRMMGGMDKPFWQTNSVPGGADDEMVMG